MTSRKLFSRAQQSCCIYDITGIVSVWVRPMKALARQWLSSEDGRGVTSEDLQRLIAFRRGGSLLFIGVTSGISTTL